jgi:hypothetical protein
MPQYDHSLLEAALIGYQAAAAKLDKAIAEIRQQLGTGAAHAPLASSSTTSSAPRKKHRISAAGRRRIAEAQRKRWAAAKKAKG